VSAPGRSDPRPGTGAHRGHIHHRRLIGTIFLLIAVSIY
jgi:hypothetical protein